MVDVSYRAKKAALFLNAPRRVENSDPGTISAAFENFPCDRPQNMQFHTGYARISIL
jgi:hypothetical protein